MLYEKRSKLFVFNNKSVRSFENLKKKILSDVVVLFCFVLFFSHADGSLPESVSKSF